MDERYFEAGLDVAEAMVLKLGHTLSAPVNFMVSRPYFRYLEEIKTTEGKEGFARGYRIGWQFYTSGAANG